MKKLVIPIHSFIDVVTNSSTSIYVGCHSNTIKYAKDLIDSLLKAAGSTKTAEDLFEFSIKGDFDKESEQLAEYLPELFPDEDHDNLSSEREDELITEAFDKINKGKMEAPYDDFGKDYEGYYDTRTLTITSKEDSEFSLNLTSQLQNMFSIDGETQEMFEKDKEQGYPWGYETQENVGKIIIEGVKDNSIPYDMWDDINGLFDGHNYHLG